MANVENLFSYGTLRDEKVQIALFGRKLDGSIDCLPCYHLETVKITDPEVIAKSGKDIHSIIKYSGNVEDQVQGMVFKISSKELSNADQYEVDDYKRIKVKLRSGILAWVYVGADSSDQFFSEKN